MPNVDGIGPVIDKGPLTPSAPLNVAIGSAVVGGTNTATTTATAGMNGPIPITMATAVFLNLIMQPLKKLKWFPEHEGTVIVGLIVSFAISYYILYHQDTAMAFVNSVTATMQSIINYKGDKASGLNLLPPVPEHLEFGG